MARAKRRVPVRVAPEVQRWISAAAADKPAVRRSLQAAVRSAQRLLSEQPLAAPVSGDEDALPGTRLLSRPPYLLAHRVLLEEDGETVREVQIFGIRHGRQEDARAPRD
jgi:plasmid stabilization system protein ParE